jgi:hypothetical protein
LWSLVTRNLSAGNGSEPLDSGREGENGAVLYRMRIYQAVTENLAVFHDFFRGYLLPVQLRHGARLVGRWETEDGRVVAPAVSPDSWRSR